MKYGADMSVGKVVKQDSAALTPFFSAGSPKRYNKQYNCTSSTQNHSEILSEG